MIRVAMADDQELLRVGFAAILSSEPDLAVVGVAVDGEEAVAVARATRPDVFLLDVRMPVRDGISALTEIIDVSPDTKVLMITAFDLDEYVYTALAAGASGFLLKHAGGDQLVEAVRVLARGDAILDPAVTRRLIAGFVRAGRSGRVAVHAHPATLEPLTEREKEVLRVLARGRSNAEIADTLVISEYTVKSHVASVLRKLGLRDRVQAVVFAYETGLSRAGETVW